MCATLLAVLLHPRPHQAAHDGRCLVLGGGGRVGVGGEGKFRVAVAQHKTLLLDHRTVPPIESLRFATRIVKLYLLLTKDNISW